MGSQDKGKPFTRLSRTYRIDCQHSVQPGRLAACLGERGSHCQIVGRRRIPRAGGAATRTGGDETQVPGGGGSTAGPAREGPALLQGLVICGRCGRRMTIRYHQRRDGLVPDYRCANDNIQRNGPVCLYLPGHTIDQAIEQLLLQTVTPLALEVALTVQAELEARVDQADQLRRAHVERAHHHAELARRRYLAVDPDNRLVADTLEADWNDALRALQAAQDEYDRQSAAAGNEQKDWQHGNLHRSRRSLPAKRNHSASNFVNLVTKSFLKKALTFEGPLSHELKWYRLPLPTVKRVGGWPGFRG